MGRMDRHKRHSAKPHWDGDILRRRLKHYDREPFLELLAKWFEMMPDDETLAKWARAYPDRWIGAMNAISKMSGFAEKKESTFNLNVNVAELSDSQLEDRLKELQEQLNNDAFGPLIELEAEPAEEGPEGPSSSEDIIQEPNPQGEDHHNNDLPREGERSQSQDGQDQI